MTPDEFGRLIGRGKYQDDPSRRRSAERRAWEQEMHALMAEVADLPEHRLPEADDDV